MQKTKISVALEEATILRMMAHRHPHKSRSQLAEEAAEAFLEALKDT
ncbi:MAG: hypothetical protein GXP63_00070 [DPANN group archaeon]|nr:hypothetical protein [DPANN group archaeon]